MNHPMLKTLTQFLARADEIETRKTELLKRRDEIRAAKEQVFESAGPEDTVAFTRIGELGSQEHLLTVQLERLDRERKGLGATLLNESNHVIAVVRKSLYTKRDRLIAKLDADLAKHLLDERARNRIVTEASAFVPELRALSKSVHIGGDGYHPRENYDEITFARGVFRQAVAAVEKHGI
jgi:hypothetical protein